MDTKEGCWKDNRGQGVIGVLLIMGAVVVLVIGVWFSRLLGHQKEVRITHRNVALQQLSLQLKALFLDPDYVQKQFLDRNQALKGAYERLMLLPGPGVEEVPSEGVLIYTPSGEPWLGIGMSLRFPSLQRCNDQESCPIVATISPINLISTTTKSVGFTVNLSTRDPSITGPMNPQRQRVDVTFDPDGNHANYENGRAECDPGFKLISIRYPDLRIWCRAAEL